MPPTHSSEQPESFRFLWPADDDQGGWITVTHGPGLPFPIEIKLGRMDRQLSLIGLRADFSQREAPAQITSRTLRQIRVGQILDELVSSYTEPKNLRGLGSDYEPALWFWKESVELLDRAAKELPPVEPAKQGREPSREQLRAFVGQYASHLRRGKRNAMTRTTKEAHMARSTGYRWLRLASQAGLLEGLEDEA